MLTLSLVCLAHLFLSYNHYLSYDVGSVSDISTCNKIDNHFWLTDLCARLCSNAFKRHAYGETLKFSQKKYGKSYVSP